METVVPKLSIIIYIWHYEYLEGRTGGPTFSLSLKISWYLIFSLAQNAGRWEKQPKSKLKPCQFPSRCAAEEMGPLTLAELVPLYPLSIPAIKLNGHTNHIANVFVKTEPQRSMEIAESISEIAHWHAPLSLTARWSSLIQNASSTQTCPNAWCVIRKPLTDSSQAAAVCSMLNHRNPCWKQDNQIVSPTRFYSQQMTVC